MRIALFIFAKRIAFSDCWLSLILEAPLFIFFGSGNGETVFNATVLCYVVQSVGIYGSPRRCGGQGDILSGR